MPEVTGFGLTSRLVEAVGAALGRRVVADTAGLVLVDGCGSSLLVGRGPFVSSWLITLAFVGDVGALIGDEGRGIA